MRCFLRPEVAAQIVSGMKQARLNFVSSLPSKGLVPLIQAISKDPDFLHVPVANEEDAIGICAGASMVGKKPAVVIQNSGLVMATYAVLDCLYWFGGFPMLMIVDHRGVFGDGGGFIFTGYGIQVPRMLESFQIPYTVVSDEENIVKEILKGGKTVEANGKPAVVLLSGEAI